MTLKTERTDERIRIFDGSTLLASYRFKTWQSKPPVAHVASPLRHGPDADLGWFWIGRLGANRFRGFLRFRSQTRYYSTSCGSSGKRITGLGERPCC